VDKKIATTIAPGFGIPTSRKTLVVMIR
jgi:hypothetical protein